MRKPIRHHHVYRIDRDASRTHCWRVQIQCSGHIVLHSFSDGLYGGKRKALQAALVWRDAMLDQVQHERAQRWLYMCTVLRKNNSSGIVGVGRYISRESGEERASWHGYWQGDDGKRHSRKFAVDKYGEKHAKALAIAARTEAMAELIAMRSRSASPYRHSRSTARL